MSIKKTLNEVKVILANNQITFIESTIANATGTRLDLQGSYAGVIINCYSSGKVTVQGSNSQLIPAVESLLK
ncbi:MAG: hypothetical protein IJ228_08585 [Succinivibrio sp.]|nr:hypothetical protein [Succinivibrio sp.]